MARVKQVKIKKRKCGVHPKKVMANAIDVPSSERQEIAPGVFLLKGFLQTLSPGADPNTLARALIESAPEIAQHDDEIVPGSFVKGNHDSLRCTRNPTSKKPLSRHKRWFQSDSIDDKYWCYSYTGFKWLVSKAMMCWHDDANLKPIADAYNAWCVKNGHVQANHAIFTHYENGSDCISSHSDKVKDLHDEGIITVIKLGPAARRFCISDTNGNAIFDDFVQPGDAIVMTMKANELYKHGVPVMNDAQESGSIVFRTSIRCLTKSKWDSKIAESARTASSKKRSQSLKSVSMASPSAKRSRRIVDSDDGDSEPDTEVDTNGAPEKTSISGSNTEGLCNRADTASAPSRSVEEKGMDVDTRGAPSVSGSNTEGLCDHPKWRDHHL